MTAQPPDATARQKLEDVRGASHRELIATQLAEERATKMSLEQRGLSVITTSGVLATLLFGLAAFAKQSQRASLGPPERSLLIAALILFVGASASSLWVLRPRSYEEADRERLQARVSPAEWSRTDVIEGYRRDAQLNVDIIAAARKTNASKASCLFAAVLLEVAAVACVAAAVALVVYRA